MTDKKSWGSTVLGWFVVQDEASPPSANARAESVDHADALIAKYAGRSSLSAAPRVPSSPSLDSQTSHSSDVATVAEGDIDFTHVYEASGVDRDERDQVRKAQDLLASLPSDTPAPTKKQIVEALLRAFGVSTEKIIEAAVAEIEALEGFIVGGQSETQARLSQSSARISELQQEIANIQHAMQQSAAAQDARARAANREKLKIQHVLEFFGQDAVAKVVHDSPKLHTPAAE